MNAVEDVDLAELTRRADALAASGRRRLLGICGAPGAGKSTIAEQVVAGLGDRAVLVGMDGFHLAQRQLVRLGLVEHKGAPDTFDAAGYLALLLRLRRNADPDGETVYAPEFRREIEEPVAGAIPVPPAVPLVVTEGNYLLLPSEPWRRVRHALDEVWFLDLDNDERLDRLVERHRRYGLSVTAASTKALGSDQRNAELIALTAPNADHMFRVRSESRRRTSG